MAVGKSVVGRKLARKLKWSFVDLDQAIEKAEGLKVQAIFERDGEAHFRELEKQKLGEVLEREAQVVATGGGAVVDEENLRLLKKRSLLVCLTATPRTLMRRSGSGRGRPLLQGGDKKRKIETLLQQRETVYAQAHLVIDTSDLSIDGVVNKIMEQIRITESAVEIGRS